MRRAKSTRWTRTPLAGTQRPCCAGATYREPRAHAADNHVAWVQRNGVSPWGVRASVAINSTFHPCRPLLASRRRPCPPRSPPGPAHPPQLSTLCQMLAALKNVLARPDAPWSCRSSICPPASPVSPARQSQRPAPSSAAVQHTPSVDIASAHHHHCSPTTGSPTCSPTCSLTRPVDAKLRNCKFRTSPADPSVRLSTRRALQCPSTLDLGARTTDRACAVSSPLGAICDPSDRLGFRGAHRPETRPLTVPDHYGPLLSAPGTLLPFRTATRGLLASQQHRTRIPTTASLGSSH